MDARSVTADDLRFFIALARTGRLSDAATRLGVDHTTVSRRISALEDVVKEPLFVRTSAGWQVTETGMRLLGPADAVNAAVDGVHEALGQRHLGLSGTVRVLCPDAFGTFLVAPALAKVHEQHPDLIIELVTETSHVGQTVRDFDVAVTLDEPVSPRFAKRRLTDYVLRLYATEGYLATRPPVDALADLNSQVIIWYVDRLLTVSSLRVLQQLGVRMPTFQSTSVMVHWAAAAAGLGIAPLPQYIAGHDDRLTVVLPNVAIRRTYWLAVPRETIRLARVRVVVEILERLVHDRAADLSGA